MHKIIEPWAVEADCVWICPCYQECTLKERSSQVWVTQTYLGDVERDAQLFVYYVYEDYAEAQKCFTMKVQEELERLGTVYGPRVSLLMPNSRSSDSIESELRNRLDALWRTIQGKLLGLLVCSRPLSEFDFSSGDYVILPFADESPQEAARVVSRVRKLLDDQLEWSQSVSQKVSSEPLWKRFFCALELKPGVGGIRIDLKKFLR